MRMIAIIAFCAIAVETAAGEPQALLMGAGIGTCAEFAQSYSRDPEGTMAVYFSWAQGFMSAMNIARRAGNKSTRDLNGMPLSSQHERLRYFCSQKPPDEPFYSALKDLLDLLPEIPPQSN